jgi:hypothetical protein
MVNLFFNRTLSELIFLAGGSGPHEGNVYTTNPKTGTFGPVCDDFWDIADVNGNFVGFVCL